MRSLRKSHFCNHTRLLFAVVLGAGSSACNVRMKNMDLLTAFEGSSGFGSGTLSPLPTWISITNSAPTNTMTYALSYGAVGGNYSHYCLLENDTDENNCTWVNAVPPSSYTVSSTESAKILSFWLKNSVGVVSSRLDTNSVTLDTTNPNSATAPAWSTATPSGSLTATASWTLSTSPDIANQRIQFYSDSSCTTASGTVIDLSSSSLQAYTWGAPSAGTYAFKVESVDQAGNTSLSVCSGALVIDQTSPSNATALGWSESSPRNSTSVTAAWTRSAAGDLSNQKLQFYADTTCTTTSGAEVDLASAVTQTYAWTTPGAGSFTYKVISVDTAGNTAASTCSSTMVIDQTAPANATSLGWSETSPHGDTGITAAWTLSTASDLSNQTLQFYSDGTCGTASGGSVNLSSNSATTYAWSAPSSGTYSYTLTSIDTAGNTATSGCSSSIVVDTTAPSNATSLGWSESSPHGDTGITASWTKSTDGDLADQKIQFYSDGSCTTTSGSEIDLTSASTSYPWTAPTEATYSYKIRSIDTAALSSTSACSSAMVVDGTAPADATGLGWTETTPHGDTSITASWTKSTAVDLADQKIQFYSDSGCTTVSGAEIDLTSASTTYAWTAPGEGSFKYRIRSIDTAGNSGTTSCSPAMVVDTTAPVNATSLTWSETSPHGDTSVTASWTKSVATDLANQKIQFYSDGTCTTASGSEIDLASSSATTYAWTAPGEGTFAYKLTSVHTAGNSATSGCSGSMVVDTTAPANATSLTWTEGTSSSDNDITASWTKSTSGDLSNQNIQFYSDGTCTTTSGSLINLASNTATTHAWTAPGNGTYSYKLLSLDAAGNTATTGCSPGMTTGASAFTYDWPFTAGTDSSYSFASSLIDLTGGVARLKATDQVDDDNTASGFLASGSGGTATHSGVTWDATNSYLRLDHTAVPVNSEEHRSSWTPQFSALVSHWKTEGDWQDAKGANDGAATNAGAFTTQAKIGTMAGSFNGTNDSVTLTSLATEVQDDTSGTFMAWIYPQSVGSSSHVIFMQSDMNDTDRHVYFEIDSNRRLEFNFRNNTSTRGSDWVTIQGTTLFDTRKWYHVAVTANGSAYKLYVNGAEETISSTNGSNLGKWTGHLVAPVSAYTSLIGRFQTSGSAVSYFHGFMDEVAIWNAALSTTEVASIYDRQGESYGHNTAEHDLSWTPKWANVVGLWHLNESAATAGSSPYNDFADSSTSAEAGEAYNGVVFGAAGKLRQAATFDGTNDYIIIAGSSANHPASALTVSAWAKLNSYSPTEQQIVSSFETGGYSLEHRGTASTGCAANTFCFKVRVNGASRFVGYTAVGFTAGQWHHLVGTYDGANLKLYVNGRHVATTAYAGTPEYTYPNGPVCIGSDATATACTDGGYVGGSIDEVAIWNTALTATDIEIIHSRQSAKYSGTLTSRVMDVLATGQSWTTFSWIPTLPFFKALPDYASGTIQNETSTDYTSLVGSTGSTGANDLMTGIIGLWHLDEASLGSAPSNSDFKDHSGNGHHLTLSGTATPGALGKISSSVTASDGQLEPASFGHNLDAITVAAWVKVGNNVNWGTILATNEFQFVIKDSQTPLFRFTGGTAELSTKNIKDGLWHHLAVTYDKATISYYVDGIFDVSRSRVDTLNIASLRLLKDGLTGFGGTDPLVGSIDEVAIWNRTLHANEIRQLYRRGANRLKHQIRICTAADCSDKDADTANGQGWKGPDGSNQSYFSELYNMSTQSASPSGTVNKTLPSILFSNFTSPVGTSRYFQYRTILESDDTSTGCDYGSGATWCSPELKSVTVDPVHYDSSSPAISSVNGTSFASLSSFIETLGASCSSGIGYNLSLNKTNWYWWDSTKASDCTSAGSGAWCLADGTVTKSSAASVINTNTPTFGTQVGTGTVYIKAYLKSSGTTACELDNVRAGGMQ